MPTKTKGLRNPCLGPFDATTKTWTRRCRLDLTPIIEERVPVDGKSHDFECPRCKAPHHATRMPTEVAVQQEDPGAPANAPNEPEESDVS